MRTNNGTPKTVRPPLYWACDNLAGGYDGGTWAMWQLRPVAYRYLDPVRKRAELARNRALMMQLPEVAQLFGVCRPQEPAEVIELMMAGIDPETAPAWLDEAVATGDWLCDRPPAYRRSAYLACRLPDQTGLRPRLDAAMANIAAATGRHPAPVVPDDLGPARQTVDRLYELLGGARELTPIGAGELRWLLARARNRGIDEPVHTPDWDVPDGQPISLLPVADALLDHPDDTGASRWLPRRHVTVRSSLEGRDVLSEQAIVVVSGLPSPGWLFPGGEIFDALERLEVPVDWHMHLRTRSNDDTRRAANRQYRRLISQIDEWSGDPRGAPAELALALDGIETQLGELAADSGAGEHEVTLTLQVGAPTPEELEQRLATIRGELRRLDCHDGRPRGDQAAWWVATLPGAPTTPAVRAYRHHLPPSSLAGLMPNATSDLGDSSGILAGLNRGAGTARLVLHDPARGPREHRSGSEAIVAGLGGGKGFWVKRKADAVVRRDGGFVTPDRNGEYVQWAASLDPERFDVQVVEITPNARICLDPMRMFAGDDRVKFTRGFLSVLTGVPAQSARGTVLVNAIHDVADADGTTGQIVDRLDQQGRTGDQPAAEVAAQLRGLARGRGLARLVFAPDPAAPPLRLDADAVVLYCPGLELPDADTLKNPVLAEKMTPEHIEGQAFAYLIAAIMRQVLFADRRRFAYGLFDEAHALTRNPWGFALIRELVREARKYNAAAGIVSQDADDLLPDDDYKARLPDDEQSGRLASLLTCKWVGRQEDEGGARRALRLLGAEPTPELIHLLTVEFKKGSGHFLHRDLDGNLGVVDILEPLDEVRRAAYDTSPAAFANQGTG